MNTQYLLLCAVFILLSASGYLFLNRKRAPQNGIRREENGRPPGIKRNTPAAKLQRLEEKRRNLIADMSISPEAYTAVTIAGTAIGAAAGKLLFREPMFVAALAVLGAGAPILYLSYRRSKLNGRRLDRLLSSMAMLSGSFIATDDFITSVRNNIDRLEEAAPFREFLAYISYIDSDVVTGLHRLDARVNNPFFSEWIGVIIMAQEDRQLKYAAIPIVEAMNDIRQAQSEADTAMFGIWSEYLTVLSLIFCTPVVIRLLMPEAYDILVTTALGQFLLVLLTAAVVFSLLRAVKLNRPVLS